MLRGRGSFSQRHSWSGASLDRRAEAFARGRRLRQNDRIPALPARRTPSHQTIAIALTAVAGLILSCARPLFAAGYNDLRAAALARCDAIDPSASQSGLAFNPDGFRSYYVRSECLQTAAVQFRDEGLCDRVRQRQALLWSSWGYSPMHCRDLVQQGVHAQRPPGRPKGADGPLGGQRVTRSERAWGRILQYPR